jgi:transposase InsO family protein
VKHPGVSGGCRALEVSQSWFYKWRDGTLPPRTSRRQRLKAEVALLFRRREGKEGSPRVTAALRGAGWRVSENTVAGLMRGQGLAARPKRRRKGTTRPGKGRWWAEDLVKRKFTAGGINRRWYGDGTEVKTAEGKLYLDSVTDTGSRRILGYALGKRHDTALACGALAMAVAVRGLGIALSMGRPGSALDNAVIESWHSTLEFELRSLRQFATKAEARAAVAAWIEDYNWERTPRDRGGPAARAGKRRRLRRSCPSCAR